MRHMFDMLKTPDKGYFVKVIPKGLVFLYHYTKAKLFVVKNGVF